MATPRSRHVTLTANTEMIVQLAQLQANWITVHVRSDHTVYFSVDGSAVTVAGDDRWVVHPKSPVQPVQIWPTDAQRVRLISAGPAEVSVLAEQR